MTGLEALKIVERDCEDLEQVPYGEFALIEKSLKALEIIKKKDPNITEIKCCKDYEHYKLRMSSKYDTEIVKIDWNDKSLLDYLALLTEEEFYTLNEVLKC